MGLSFLAPFFFAGLAALAVPVLVHLSYRQKATVVPFPSLMFVQKVPFKSMRRQTIRHWLLFLLRCAALVLLVLAFSRPFFDQANIAAALSPASREVVILVDNSHSMSYTGRWEAAQAAARETIAALTPADRASLVFFSDAAQLAVRSTPEPSVLAGALGAVAPTHRATRYAPAINLARQLLAESDLPTKEIVLISDYQRSGWDREQPTQLAAGTVLTGIDAAAEESSNVSISTVVLQREAAAAGDRFIVNARLVNQSDAAVEDLEVTLRLADEAVETRSVTLDARSAGMVQFRPRPVADEALRGAVVAGSDGLPDDNTFYFVVGAGDTLNVVLLENDNSHATDSLFVQGALSVGTRPAFRLRRTTAGRLRADELAGIDAVIINDAPFPSGAAGAALHDFIAAGGGAFIALGELTRPDGWGRGDAALLAPEIGADIVQRFADVGGTLAGYDRTHPVFEIFATPRSGDFTAASFYRYRRLEPGPEDVVLATFDDGNPALLARTVGRGAVLVFPTSLDRFWNDLAFHGQVFVPFMQRAVQYVAGYREADAWQTVGGSVRLATLGESPLAAGTEVSLRAPDGDLSTLIAAGAAAAAGPADPAAATDRIALRAPGFYELGWDDANGEQRLAVAANLDRAESDLAKLDPEEFAAALNYRGGAAGDLGAEATVTAEDREASQSWWWYLLVVAFVALIAETTLSNRLSPRPPAVSRNMV